MRVGMIARLFGAYVITWVVFGWRSGSSDDGSLNCVMKNQIVWSGGVAGYGGIRRQLYLDACIPACSLQMLDGRAATVDRQHIHIPFILCATV